MRRTTCALVLGVGVVGALSAGCRDEVAAPPRAVSTISVRSDRFFAVEAMSADRALVIGDTGKILETRDGGRTWEIIPTPTERALYDISFGDAEHGWIVGQGGVILHTTDGGTTWAEQASGAGDLFALDAISATHVYAVGDGSSFVETTDGGATWSARRIDSQRPDYFSGEGWELWLCYGADPVFYDVQFANNQEGVAVGAVGTIARTRDGGATWAFEAIDEDVAGRDPLYAPLLRADGTGWAIGSGGDVVAVAPGQSIWKRAALGIEIHTWLRGIDFFDDHHGWIVGGFGTILSTEDGGRTWRRCYD